VARVSQTGQELWALDLVDATRLVAAGEIAPSELVASALARLEAVEPFVHAFVAVDAERALREAREQDGQPRGPLCGIPVGVKDIFDLAGTPTCNGTAAFAGATPAVQDAAAVARLREAGAVVLGKTATHELACGVYTPPTRNPWDLERSPGGSSGGSAAAVAAGPVLAAIGSDTGGSIRIPAAHCGLVGIKPTYGRVSRAGALTLSWSLDHIGPLARTVEDAALLLEVLAVPDPNDPTTLGRPPLPELLLRSDDELGGLRVGVLSSAPFAPLEPDVRSALDGAVSLLTAEGVEVEETALPELEQGLAAEFAIVAAEAASYHETRLARSGDLIGDDVRGLLETGLLLPASVYLRAQRTRRVIQQAFATAFAAQQLDALIAPTVPAAPQGCEQLEYELGGAAEPVIEALVRTTAPFNLAGLPAVAVPTGLMPSGFPGSVQFVGRPFDERTALRLACAIQRGVGRSGAPRGLELALADRSNRQPSFD
jgi:aspartyl-tRNA(Asn)/glutamyl-tRNA(Gln) amidotransferase subunit A